MSCVPCTEAALPVLTSLLLLLVCLLLCTLTEVVHSQFASPKTEWSRQDIPNPQTSPQACGRYSEASYVCDPNHILSDSEADYLDSLIYDIRWNTGGCHCDKQLGHSCPSDPRYGGYHAAVAVLQKLQISNGATDEEKRTVAESYADYLRKYTWAFGKCEDDLVIIISQDDKVVFTKVGMAAKKILPDSCVDKIFKDHVHSFSYGDYGLGVTRLLESYKSVLVGESSCTKSLAGLYIFIGVVVTVIVVIVILVVLKWRGFIKCPKRRNSRTRSDSTSEVRHTPGHRRQDGASFTFGTGRNVFE